MRVWNVPGTSLTVPVIGQGTWGFGASGCTRTAEIDALREGIARGLTFIDTAEFYAGGGAESVVGEAVRDIREQVFIMDKLWPRYRHADDMLAGADASLRRLGTDYLDALLWHWPSGAPPLSEIAAAFAEMQQRGWIRTWGVSNFWEDWLDRLDHEVPSADLRWNQMPYSLDQRALEGAVLDRSLARGIGIIAYSPLSHGHLPVGREALATVARRRGVSPQQVALAWVTRHPGVIAVPKAATIGHVRANAESDFVLELEELEILAQAFPRRPRSRWRTMPSSPALFRLIWAATARGTDRTP